MSKNTIKIKSINQLHELQGWDKPKHPLISIVKAEEMTVSEEQVGTTVISDLYMIALKDKNCGVEYGRNLFDFDEGVLVFTSPKQASRLTKVIERNEIHGWMLYFHPDLIYGTHLADAIDDYSFFNYEVFEALHLSKKEEQSVLNCVESIKNEYQERIDNHSQRVIVSNIELLLNYCLRFYERQFNTRKKQNIGLVSQFENELKSYFDKEIHVEQGLPSIQYLAEKIHLSPHYLSDLLKKETGRSAKLSLRRGRRRLSIEP